MDTILMDRFTQFRTLYIQEPRWHDRRVLLADHKLGKYNKVIITALDKDGNKHFPDTLYISGRDAKKFPKQSNGTIDCRAVPINEFKILEISERSLHDIL